MIIKHIRKYDCKENHQCLFCSLNLGKLPDALENKSPVYIKKGQYIYIQGTRPQGIFCVFQGKIKIVKCGGEGREQITRLAKSGDLIGLNSYFQCKDYADAAITLEDSYLCQIPKEAIEILIQEIPLANAMFKKYLCKVSEELEMRYLNLSQKNVRERLAIGILYLNDYFGIHHKNQMLIDLPLSREDLANLIGTATETVIRILSDFRKEGILCFLGKKILITDVSRLKKISKDHF